MAQKPTRTYAQAGVDTDREEEALKRLVHQVQRTWRARTVGRVVLDIGYFANVIDLGGVGLALTADGVGTKVLIAQMMNRYDTVGIDCVAMNVNDLLCVGATPVSMVDYLALDNVDPDQVDAIAQGLATGAEQANISIAGGEMAQLRDIITGIKSPAHGGSKPLAFDLAGMAIGTVPLDRILIGRDMRPGDAIIGIESHGIHSNGLSLARKVFFDDNSLDIHATPPALSCSLGEELLKPTYIYVPEIVELLREHIPIKALIHITSDGLLNLSRVDAPVGYIIEAWPPIPPIFALIKDYSGISDSEWFRVFNLGIGFCIIAPEEHVDHIMTIIQAHHKHAHRLGHVIADERKRVHIKPYKLIGEGKHFYPAEGDMGR